jgi:hypothetical protein
MRVLGVVSLWVSTSVTLGACVQAAGPPSGESTRGDDGGSARGDDGGSARGDDGGSARGDDGGSAPTEVISSGVGKDGGAEGATMDVSSPPVEGGRSSMEGDAVASAVPTIGGCPIFSADSAWNTRIDDPRQFPVHPQSTTYIANMSPATHLHPDWGNWSTDHYGIPWQTVPGAQVSVPMTFSYASESDPGPYPFPTNALVEGGVGSGGDMHVLVIETGTCALYETWSSTYVGPGWTCGSGAKFDLRSNTLRTDGWTSADAAGLPVLPGLVKVSEIEAGAVHHALRFTMNSTQQAYIHPATHAAGKSNPSLPPMGLRLRLKASFNAASFTGPARVVLTAMQQYGLILADNGSDWYVSGDSDDAWSPLMDAMIQALDGVHGSDFEAVDTGPISTAGL